MTGLALLTVFLLSLGGVTTVGFVLKKKMALSSHCVHSVLKLQNDLRTPLERLLKLNKQAFRLRLQRKLAQAKLAAAVATGNPGLIAAARARLMIVTERQLALKAKQQMLLMESRLRRRQFHLLRLPSSFSRKTHFMKESDGLAVRPRPLGSLTPNYETAANFKQTQGQSYEVRQNLSPPLFGFQKMFLKNQRLLITERCSATLKRKGLSQWKPVLKKAKGSWRYLYGSL